jgi:hypothetical protein
MTLTASSKDAKVPVPGVPGPMTARPGDTTRQRQYWFAWTNAAESATDPS